MQSEARTRRPEFSARWNVPLPSPFGARFSGRRRRKDEGVPRVRRVRSNALMPEKIRQPYMDSKIAFMQRYVI